MRKTYNVTTKDGYYIYPHCKIRIESEHLLVIITHTNNPLGFKVFTYPTNNCQVESISGIQDIIETIFFRNWYDLNYFSLNPTSIPLEEKVNVFKQIMFEVRDAIINKKGHNCKQFLLDIEESYLKYFEKGFINIPEEFFVFKQAYASTNGSSMIMLLINMQQLLKYWYNEELQIIKLEKDLKNEKIN